MGIYQAKNKNEFINKFINNENHWRWFFANTFSYEQKLNKDILDFNKEEIISWLKDKKITKGSAKSYLDWLKMYQEWGLQQGEKRLNIIEASTVTEDELEGITIKDKDLLSFNSVYNAIGKSHDMVEIQPLLNYQDMLLVYLAFLGAASNKTSVLTEIKHDHFDFDNKILRMSQINNYYNDIIVDDYCLYLVDKVKNTNIYNRYMDLNSVENRNKTKNFRTYYDVVGTDYIFKPTIVGVNVGNTRVSSPTLSMRAKAFSKYTGLNLSLKNVEKSGKAYFLKLIIDRGYKISIHSEAVVNGLFKRFSINTNDDDRMYQSLISIKKDLLKIYPEYTDLLKKASK
ncbi:phage lytic cycle repressor MrpR family protein [Paraliobacillus ryukyuensis]|uniref:phage lytic cycle repressor MrpR family protein n=1 Tax=Paraliobacillus ryukyuensis TaxID=200904 RepID=UPI0009A82FD8|nr:hypothetical protein [Paraliobacillus ryukyuensis]